MAFLGKFYYGIFLLSFAAILPAFVHSPVPKPLQTIRSTYIADLIALDSATTALQRAIEYKQPNRIILKRFRDARLAYKRVEWLTEAYFPFSARLLNGPPVPDGEVEGGASHQTEPHGFQVVEELIMPYKKANHKKLVTELAVIQRTVRVLWQVGTSIPLTDSRIFDAMRLQVFRTVTLGITGFDSPIAQQSLPEAIESLNSIRQALSVYPVSQEDHQVAIRLDSLLVEAARSLNQQPFHRFDRLTFIRQFANPLSKALVEAQIALKIPVFTEKRLLSSSAQTLSDSGIFNPHFFAPGYSATSTQERIALGKKLFFSTLLSSGGHSLTGRSCASCHQPERAFTDGLPTAFTLGSVHERLKRNTPTLLNAGLQGFQFLDARSPSIEDQISDVLTNPREMGGVWPKVVLALKEDSIVRVAFANAYANQEISRESIANAIAHYVRSLTSLNTRFDRFMRQTPSANLSTQEQEGFNLFMGKAKCATCHFYPLFNGTLPPVYTRTESEVIGVPATAEEQMVSPDSGRFLVSKLAIHLRAFKVPGLREIAQTAPYMHNGAYQTLEQVIDFYNKGGGNGLGFSLPNQTLPSSRLHLTKTEKKALIAFLQTLSETPAN